MLKTISVGILSLFVFVSSAPQARAGEFSRIVSYLEKIPAHFGKVSAKVRIEETESQTGGLATLTLGSFFYSFTGDTRLKKHTFGHAVDLITDWSYSSSKANTADGSQDFREIITLYLNANETQVETLKVVRKSGLLSSGVASILNCQIYTTDYSQSFTCDLDP